MSIQFGRYELLKKLAAGGMGQVFLARKKGVGFEKLVVLKRILPHLIEDEDFFTMFLDEVRIAARLNHPNIVQIFDVEAEAGQHLVVMEYVQGEDVRRIEKKARSAGQKVPIGVVLRIIADAAAGLDYAHKARDDRGQPLGIVHRDISPQNLLVGFDGGVKLIDFGVAKAAGRAQHTTTGVLKGKFPYMSPEQADGEEIDGRSDVFALGIVMWELLCDRRLFKGESDVMSQRLVRTCLVPAPSELDTKLPKALDALVLKALARNRDERFPDAQALREAIEQYCLEAHVPASTSHLGAYMQKLYAEKIAQLADPARLDELPPGSDLEGFSGRVTITPSAVAGSRRGSAVLGGGTTATPAPDAEAAIPTTLSRTHTEAVGRPAAAPSSRAPMFVGAAVLAACVVGGLGLFAARRDAPPAPPPRQEREAPKSEVAAAQPLEKEKPAPVALKLETEPTGAEVEVGGVPRGMTPLDLTFERTSLPVLLKVSRDGFEPQQTTLTADTGPTLTLQLKKKRTAQSRPLEIKTGR